MDVLAQQRASRAAPGTRVLLPPEEQHHRTSWDERMKLGWEDLQHLTMLEGGPRARCDQEAPGTSLGWKRCPH